MNTYSRALRHIDMKDVKRKHHQKIVEEKIKQQEIEKEREYIQSIMEDKKYDWRKELNEGMTSTNTFFTTLPATGDIDLVNSDTTFSSMFNAENANVINSEVVLSGSENSISGGEFTIYRRAMFNVDASKSSTLKLTIQKGGGISNWTDRGQSWNDSVSVVIYSDSDPFGPDYYNQNLPSGTHLINLPGQFSDLIIQIEQFAKVGGTGSLRITNASLQRRTPLNVFVPLDSPEAVSFIRSNPNLSDLSPQERLQKLKEMLNASDEYVMKILGSNFPGTGAVPPGEYDPFAQTPPGEAGDTPGVDIASLPPGPSGYKAPGTYDPKQFYDYSPPGVQPGQKPAGEFIPSPNLPMTGPGLSKADQDTQIAQNEPLRTMGLRPDGTHGYNKPGDKVYDPASGKTFEVKPGPDGRYQWMKVNVKSKDYQVAHYEPEGQLISEKRKLKSPEEILNRIPGYYPNKPAPLGFPVEQPPKMVNGMHPDLVNGKKVSDRFNRLDPESAKATPLTGNPYIDKKIKKARKQPK